MSPDAVATIRESVSRLESYIRKEEYRGYDPFDALTSPVFGIPVVGSLRPLRMVVQQVVKRSRWNVRPLLGIRKGLNPVTLGLCLQAYSYLSRTNPERRSYYLGEIDRCIDTLTELRSPGYSGMCWGYEFPWEARYASLVSQTPTIVATGIITNALFVCSRTTQNQKAASLVQDSVRFVLHDLHRTSVGNTVCFSYSPLDEQCVLNATMKGARLLAQAYSLTRDPGLVSQARQTVQFVVDQQNEDGSWPYAYGDKRTWVDNFHTGYVLDCLDEYIRLTGDEQFVPFRDKGFSYYRSNFFQNGDTPKYYDSSASPLDMTAAAQSILTLVRFGHSLEAENVALNVIRSMQDPAGFFYYQRVPGHVTKTSFMRWSNAWMLAGLSLLLLEGAKS